MRPDQAQYLIGFEYPLPDEAMHIVADIFEVIEQSVSKAVPPDDQSAMLYRICMAIGGVAMCMCADGRGVKLTEDKIVMNTSMRCMAGIALYHESVEGEEDDEEEECP